MRRFVIYGLVLAIVMLAVAAGAPAAGAAGGASLGASPGASLNATPLLGTPTPAPAGAPVPSTWTIALYVNADNNLEYCWPRFTLPALKALPADPNVNVVAMIDWRSVARGVDLVRISGGTVTKVAHWADRDFGSGATFRWFLQQVGTRYPAQHLVVTAWDHGYGWRYFARDDTSRDAITMPELRAALIGANVPIDILSFDACNMADVEVAYDIGVTGMVKYLVGSEETIDQDGYPYDEMFYALTQDPSRTPEQVAADMVAGYRTYYRPLRCFTWVSLSAIDVAKVVQARTDLTLWIARLRADIPQFRDRYAAALRHSIWAWESWHTDLADVAGHLAADPKVTDVTLRTLSAKVAADANAATMGIWSGSYAREFKGLTLWWGTGWDWRTSADTYRRQVAFGREVGWYGFLRAYNAAGGAAPETIISRAKYGLTDVVFPDGIHGWATGFDNVTSEAVVLRSADGGAHWQMTKSASWYAYMTSAVAALDPAHAWLVGSEGYDGSLIIKTTTGGGPWSWQYGHTPEYFSAVDFVNSHDGWIAGTNGTLLRTTNGGRAWAKLGHYSNTDLWSVDFATAQQGWLVGGDAMTGQGVIEYSSDGGGTWTTQTTIADGTVFSVDATSATTAWAVGGDANGGHGFIVATANGGSSWQTQLGGASTPWLSDVAFVNDSLGWAVGEQGAVYRTIDGGLNWTPVDLKTKADLTAVSFSDAQTGWIVGVSEKIWRTTDGGATWLTTRATGFTQARAAVSMRPTVK
jgi:photosystem II stability/assembly factor-like uncharacterized protein